MQNESDLKTKYQKDVETYQETKMEKELHISKLERMLSDREYDIK